MTLHLVYANASVVVHVSDRLVTRLATGAAFDVAANKTVLVEADDAFVSVGYTGPAYLGGIPTDQWLASVFWGQPAPSGGVTFGGPSRLGDIGLLVRRVVGRLEAVRSNDAGLAAADLFVVGAGTQWKRRSGLSRAVMFSIGCRRSGAPVSTVWSPRAWASHPRGWQLTGFPRLPEAEFATISGEVAMARNKLEVTGLLARAVRASASHHSTIGPHCMAVAIPRANDREVETIFLPDPHAPATPGAGGTIFGSPAAYCPYVVRPGELVAPGLMIGGFLGRAVTFRVRVMAPRTDTGAIGFHSPPRPASPSR